MVATSDGPRPLLGVLLDDGSGTFPFDVTPWVNLRSGDVQISRGRPDETSTVEASTLRLQLDNVDGRFTAGASSPYAVFVDQPIRVTMTKGTKTSIRFTGFVQEWPTQWTTPTGTYAVAQITAVDRFPRLARHTLQRMSVEETLLAAPLALYPLTEEDGARSAGDVSGNRNDTLVAVGDEWATLVTEQDDPATKDDERQTDKVDLRVHFGQKLEARPLGTGVHFAALTPYQANHLAARSVDVQPQMLRGDLARPVTTAAATVSLFLRTRATDATVLNMDWLKVTLGDEGRLRVEVSKVGDVLSDQPVNDGDPHHIAIRVETSAGISRLVKLIVDGTAQDFDTGLVWSANTERSRSVQLGGRNFSGILSHFAVWDTTVDGATLRRIGDVGLNGAAGDSPEARLARLAAYSGVRSTVPQPIPQTIPFTIGASDPGLFVEPGVTRSLAEQELAGSSMLDAARAVEASEAGLLFVDGTGRLVMHNRRHRNVKASGSPTLTVTADQLVGADLTFTVDPQRLVNQASGASHRGGTQMVSDKASIARHELYPTELGDLLIDSDREVLSRLDYLVATYAEPMPRASVVPVDLLTVDLTTQQAALSLELGDRVQVTNLPSQAPGTVADVLVEGWVESLSDSGWSLTLNTSPADPARVWVLGTSALGAATSRLGY